MFLRLIILLLLIKPINLFAQQTQLSNELIEQKLDQYQKANPSLPLFLHIDKTIYTNNEPIWFSAYLLNNGLDSTKHTILSIGLIDDLNREILLTQKYKMHSNLSFGALTLPDTIPPGNYHLIAFTNLTDVSKNPIANFSTKIIIKNTTRQDFTSSLSLIDSVADDGLFRAKIRINYESDSKSKIAPIIESTIGNSFFKANKINNKEFLILIPKEHLLKNNSILQAKVKFNKQIQHLQINLPKIKKEEISARFFPEGGDLSYDLPNVIAWETKTENDIPIAVKGILYQDDTPIDTIETNSYGAGKFSIKPKPNNLYTLKIVKGNYLNSDTTFYLPRPLNKGLVLNLPNAISNDTLKVNLFTKSEKNIQILLKNRNGVFANFKLNIKSPGNSLKLPINNLPRGIFTITIFDNGKPAAERLFFAKYNDKVDITVKTDKEIYNKKDSVKVKILLKNTSGEPVNGVFSVASIQENRLNSDFLDIENYLYLKHDLGDLPKDPSGKGFLNSEYLEFMLLIKGWRKYTWQDILNEKDTSQNLQTPQITGTVKYNSGRLLNEPVQLIALGASNMELITTQKNGEFKLQKEQLYTSEGKKITLMVSGKNNSNYKIHLEDPFLQISTNLARNIENYRSEKSITNSSLSSSFELKGLENNYNLQEVTIKAKNANGSFYGFKGEPGVNDCGDFVDEAGHFNYEKATKRFKPKPNTLYVIRTDLNESWFTVKPYYYVGCPEKEKTVLNIGGIYGERIFYGVSNPLEDIQYLSTLFWRPGIVANKEGFVEINFKTSDIADNFKIVVQGISENNVFSGVGSFVVK